MDIVRYLCSVFIEMLKNMDYKEIKTQEEFDKAKEEFMKKNPTYHDPKPIECLNLLLRKEFAKQILEGKKVVEFRAFSEHYAERLIDKDCCNWISDHSDDDEAMFFTSQVRPVDRIHFHNYNNTWSLDVECIQNDTMILIDKDVQCLRDKFGCTELDEMLIDFNKRKEENRPLFFYFAIGDVIERRGL